MITDHASKTALIDQLQMTLQKAQHLRMTLLVAGDLEGVNAITAKNRVLMREIERLLAAAMEDWAGSATSVLDELRAANRSIQAALRDVQKDIRRAERVLKILGRMDEVIARARALL